MDKPLKNLQNPPPTRKFNNKPPKKKGAWKTILSGIR